MKEIKRAFLPQKPLTNDPNLEQEKEVFLEIFLQKGKYLKFVSLTNDGAVAAGDRLKVGKEYKIGIVVSVQKDALRKDLESQRMLLKRIKLWILTLYYEKTIHFSIICFTLSSCNNLRQVSANYDYKTECAGVEGDGSQTLIAWGNGRNRFDVLSKQRMNAVRDVIFKGISDGKDGCNKRPVLGEVNARQKYEDYFNAF